MEIRIGVQNATREVVLESTRSAAEVVKAVEEALSSSGLLSLDDDKGRTVLVPTSALGYVEIGAEEARRVGFGTL